MGGKFSHIAITNSAPAVADIVGALIKTRAVNFPVTIHQKVNKASDLMPRTKKAIYLYFHLHLGSSAPPRRLQGIYIKQWWKWPC
jgi:hypothetical protein